MRARCLTLLYVPIFCTLFDDRNVWVRILRTKSPLE